MCWPANIVGAAVVALLIFDIIQKEYSHILYHGIVGVCVTGLFWCLCLLLGESITMAVLVVPLVFGAIFLFTIWFMNESMKARGCCMTCGNDSPLRAHLVKREHAKNATLPSSTVSTATRPTCISKLTATPA